MKKSTSEDHFFIGYISKVPAQFTIYLLTIVAVTMLIMAGLAFAVGSRSTDPGDGLFIGKRQSYIGVIQERPYPIFRTVATKNNPKPRAFMLTAPGKAGLQSSAKKMKGEVLTAGGFILARGDMEMLQVGGGGLEIANNVLPYLKGFKPKPSIPLGRWHLTGEICDGKCYAGAMRPGNRLSHKACANLCLVGGVPPVFVSTGEIQGTSFFLLADQNGNPLPDKYYDMVAILIELEGEVERLDDILVFKVDVSKAKVL